MQRCTVAIVHCLEVGAGKTLSMKCQGVDSFHFAGHEDVVENSHTQYSNQARVAVLESFSQKTGTGMALVCRVPNGDLKDKACSPLYFPVCPASKQRPLPEGCTPSLPSPTLFYLLCPWRTPVTVRIGATRKLRLY